MFAFLFSNETDTHSWIYWAVLAVLAFVFRAHVVTAAHAAIDWIHGTVDHVTGSKLRPPISTGTTPPPNPQVAADVHPVGTEQPPPPSTRSKR